MYGFRVLLIPYITPGSIVEWQFNSTACDSIFFIFYIVVAISAFCISFMRSFLHFLCTQIFKFLRIFLFLLLQPKGSHEWSFIIYLCVLTIVALIHHFHFAHRRLALSADEQFNFILTASFFHLDFTATFLLVLFVRRTNCKYLDNLRVFFSNGF